MKVSIKDLGIAMDVKSKGVEFAVWDGPDGRYLGKLFVTMTNLIWCNGKESRENGKRIPWREFIAYAHEQA